MTNPLVSVIIPAYNAELTLRDTVLSVLAQTHQTFEIIIVDDCSTDTTKQIGEAFVLQDSRISYHQLAENSGGAAKPKNIGIQKAHEEYIAVLDADDIWHPEKLEKQLELLRNNPSLEWVGCAFAEAKPPEKDQSFPGGLTSVRKIPDVRHQTAILVKDYMGPGSCIMYKKSVFDEVGLFDPQFKNNQDWDMRIRLAVAGKHVDFINEPLVDYLIHDQNVSHRNRNAIPLYLRKITKKHWKTLIIHPMALFLHMFYLITRHILYSTGFVALWNKFK